MNSLNVQVRENSMENQRMYQTMKIQLKIVYVRCTSSPNLLTNLFSLKIQNRENSTENIVHLMYRSLGFVKKFKFTECKNSWKFDRKSMNIPNRENSMENCVHKMYRSGLVDSLRNLISLTVQNHENSMENYVH